MSTLNNNNFSDNYPNIAKQWHPFKNYPLEPSDVTLGSNKKVWWMCHKGHEWQVSINNRTFKNSDCPYCTNHKVCSDNSLATINPQIAQEWHPTKNNPLGPSEVTPGSNKKVWWLCHQGHEWQATTNNRTNKNSGCPYCLNQKVCIDNCLATKSPHLSKEWHPIKNYNKIPFDYINGSNKKVWWQCDKGHEWEARIANRTRKDNPRGCPYCSNKKVNADTSLESVNPSLAKEWNYKKNINITPNDVLPISGKKVWWVCNKGHEWRAAVATRSYGKGCPYCSSRKVCKDNNLLSIFPRLAEQWHPKKNNNLSPNNVTSKSNKKVWWLCNEGHEWQATINSRASGNNCPECNIGSQTSFPEMAILYYCMNVLLNLKISSGKKIHGYNTDIIINDEILIEYDGYYYHKGKYIHDSEKTNTFIKNGFYVIRVREEGLERLEFSENYICFDVKDGNRKSLNNVILKIMLFLINRYKINYDLNDDTINTIRDEIEIYNLITHQIKENSILNRYPDLTIKWNYNKNKKLNPSNILANSGRRIWWICKNGHEYQRTVTNEVKYQNCPICEFNIRSLAKVKPLIAKQWHPHKNGELTPENIYANSNKKVWWLCDKGHEFQMVINNRRKANFCPICHGRETNRELSLLIVKPDIAKEWNYEKNKELTPDKVKPYSNKRVWWICNKGHEYQYLINNRTRKNNKCPICRKEGSNS
ncbi:zinc-ribbon domain-containing protein [Calidifontibacillus oryziterrae]|uniref:zinc-ribbon domain-containing protein n=1 Tax=Calidifontibacillus oryziterrae TaxID=1191699 RepID=UPI0002DA404C|nr:zinc-ribbon domain-containing protein [Calidifontibacillus oryziterrae]